ncbi:sulfite exporter TauE/SafE family protein [Chitinophaga pendula]|uniref:urease accessory protein UreH domain-containing protein n=1 Tax=Chitinophaga TaxID=79328 RepID=UPI000BAFF2BE|nr:MULTISPECIES: sulfite exporter TauE/SafE family protein [Chitinophaga]ASZ15031.1 hypothetical protein CK934_20155 [Chitinophaga sp. MD30]UCJ09269.1 sulfite exporter TauE/SafE family protein [Chitinophaga pendula]
MNIETSALLATAITISCIHTASGPDHYVPFIVLSRTRRWSIGKTILWTVLCGLGHVLSSLLIGLVGIFLGWQLSRFDAISEIRGGIAGWTLLWLGIVYLIWGIRSAWKNKPHKHFDIYDNGEMYVYEHQHGSAVVYPQQRFKVTPWVLFAIFVMGPSEPLLPLLTYSGAQQSVQSIILLITTFTLFTVLTMVTMVLLGYFGFSLLKNNWIERYMAAISGAAVTVCGIGMVFLEW